MSAFLKQRVEAIEPLANLSPEETRVLTRTADHLDEWVAKTGNRGFIGYWMDGGEVVAYRLEGGGVIVAPPNPSIEVGMVVIADGPGESGQLSDGATATNVHFAEHLVPLA